MPEADRPVVVVPMMVVVVPPGLPFGVLPAWAVPAMPAESAATIATVAVARRAGLMDRTLCSSRLQGDSMYSARRPGARPVVTPRARGVGRCRACSDHGGAATRPPPQR